MIARALRCWTSAHFSRLYDTHELTLGLFYSGHHTEDYNYIFLIPDTDDELILTRLHLGFLAQIVREREESVRLNVHEQMSQSGGQSEARIPVFKSPNKFGIHLSTDCDRDERLSRPCPGNKL
ncbi:hypothetical protein TNCV_1676231 [Trichonephila clavipes]|nr:hypothetical protein TNCV_1676231 [Trichonephila clavipes]